MAPLHAAGSNWGCSRENIAAHVVSSYTPTIKALKYAGEKSLQSLPWPEQKFLAVVMPETPSFGDLNALPEVCAIEENVARSGIPRHEGRRAARPHRQQHGPFRLPRRITPGQSIQQLPPAEEWTRRSRGAPDHSRTVPGGLGTRTAGVSIRVFDGGELVHGLNGRSYPRRQWFPACWVPERDWDAVAGQ